MIKAVVQNRLAVKSMEEAKWAGKVARHITDTQRLTRVAPELVQVEKVEKGRSKNRDLVGLKIL